MASFRFKAVNAEGARLDGEIAAAGEREAARLLERRGLSVLALEPAAAAPRARFARGRRLKDRDIVLALHELATLLASGVSLAEAVAAQSRSAHHPRLLAAFEAVSTGLRQGQPFSQALLDTGLPLPAYVGTLVRSGEKAGQLGKAVQDAVSQMEYDMQVRGEIRQALTYPTVLVAAGLGAVVMMFTFVVPKFAALLDRADDLPWLGWAVLSTGMFARQYWWLVLLALAVAAVSVYRLLRDPAARARGYERLERLPVIGAWRIESETAAWARILATLLGNRVPLLDALSLAQAGVRAPGRRARLEEVARNVRAGATLADSLEEQATLTATGYNLVRVGERSGELPAMLRSLARLCEESGRARMKQFLALLEPVAILLIGSVIGVIMIGIILAITSANDIVV
ncbi:type II secretion system protein [Pseudoxanthomonas broegbernensis]|uniref:Type II secretion system protein n=1 Tax=Pseudoxanthomonas broegbernensis TaxID=83619 RepID=A0A7V8GMN9_9GAMM|nr:type II secretion system F family protein [Pseudoxanthomonas broegbernensis]KAF1686619.1 type II secretion system protein [Pseudoxanthomonas broegbernensis]MBB6063628.1 general secretion pathway protein F [Pseudoxanthomonas broegbernensis]